MTASPTTRPASGAGKLAAVATGTQRCTGCGRTKPLTEYHTHPRNPTRLLSVCKECVRERQAAGRRRGAARRAEERKEAERAAAVEARRNAAQGAEEREEEPTPTSPTPDAVRARVGRLAAVAAGMATLDPRLQAHADELEQLHADLGGVR